jgi:lysophospholipase L1-like esterase
VASLYLVAEGDSLTFGFASSGVFGPYPIQLALMYPPTRMVSVQNFAVTGSVIADLISREASSDAPYDSRKNPVLLVWVGTNDMVSATLTPAQLMTQITTYCNSQRAAGYSHIVVFTMLPRSAAGTSVTFEADRQTFNTSLRAGYTAFADSLADVASDTRIGVSGNELDLTYYNSDKIHLNNTGYAIVATIAKAAVDRLA